MLALASFWLYLILFEAVRIEETPFWSRIIAFYTYSPFLVWLYPLGLDIALRTYVIMMALIVCYLATVIYYGSSAREGQRLDYEEMEELGINDVLRRVNPIWMLFLSRPRFYVTDSFSQNAYSSGRNIVIALDVFDEGIEVAQGVINQHRYISFDACHIHCKDHFPHSSSRHCRRTLWTSAYSLRSNHWNRPQYHQSVFLLD